MRYDPADALAGAGDGDHRGRARDRTRDGTRSPREARRSGTSSQAAQTVAKEITARGGKALAIGVDVGDAARCRPSWSEVVAEFGRLDVMFANAGIAHCRAVSRASREPVASRAARQPHRRVPVLPDRGAPDGHAGRAGGSSPPRRSTASAASRTSSATTWPRPA